LRKEWIGRIWNGVLAGILWGWLSLGVNALGGVFELETAGMHDWATFTLGGALFGLVVSGLHALACRAFGLTGAMLGVRGTVVVSTSFWILLRLGGALLSTMEPERYHVVGPQVAQGVVLAVLLGVVLGLLQRHASSEPAGETRSR